MLVQYFHGEEAGVIVIVFEPAAPGGLEHLPVSG